MDFFKNNYTIISTGVFVTTIVVAHIFSNHNYDWTKNTISDLGSQGYDKKIIMQFGFLSFGLTLMTGIFLNGVTLRKLPVLIYGLCVALTGVFCTKPFFHLEEYAVSQARIHSVFAQFAGMAFTLGIIVQLIYSAEKNEKAIHLLFLILVLVFSAAFGLTKNYQGLFQRLLYLTSFIWLIRYFKT